MEETDYIFLIKSCLSFLFIALAIQALLLSSCDATRSTSKQEIDIKRLSINASSIYSAAAQRRAENIAITSAMESDSPVSAPPKIVKPNEYCIVLGENIINLNEGNLTGGLIKDGWEPVSITGSDGYRAGTTNVIILFKRVPKQ